MRFELSDDQALLRDATADFLTNESAIGVSRQISEAEGEGFSREQWKKLAELGYLGLILPEAVGGQGLGAVELAIVCEQMGRVCFPGPYLDVVLAAKVAEIAGGQEALLSDIVRGDAIAVLATVERVWPGAEDGARFAGGKVQGLRYFVPFGAAADMLLVPTDAGLVLAEGPFRTEPMPTIDEATRFAHVALDNAATLLGGNDAVDEIGDLAAVAAGALALGVSETLMDASVEYAKQRETFGRPIGTYQVLQHRMADMLLRTESSRSTVYRAAWSLDNDTADRSVVAAAAKQYAVESAVRIAKDTVQIHGGNGFTWEYDVHRYLKRALTLEQHYGSQATLLDRAFAGLQV